MKRILVFFSCFTFSCGSMISGTTENLKFYSDPNNAKVIVQPTGEFCRTPCDLEISKKAKYIVFHKKGYEDKQESIEKSLNPIALIGDLFTYGIGYIIDYANGGLWIITKKTYDVELKPKD